MLDQLRDWFWIAIVGFILLYPSISDSASNENLGRPRDHVDELITHGQVEYCKVVADFWDDGVWAVSMGIADAIFAKDPASSYDTPDKLPLDGIRHRLWGGMNEHERGFYAALFHDGWKIGKAFMTEHPEVLVENPRDFAGRIPKGFRSQMEQARFEKCLREWPPVET